MNTKTKAATTAQGKDKASNKWSTMRCYGKIAFVFAGIVVSAMKCPTNFKLSAYTVAFFAVAMAASKYMSSMLCKKEYHPNPMFYKFYVAEVWATMAFLIMAQFFFPSENKSFFFGMFSSSPMFTQQKTMSAFCTYFQTFFTTTMGMITYKTKFSSTTQYFMIVAAFVAVFRGYFLFEATKKVFPMMTAAMNGKFFTMSFFYAACVWAYVKYSWFCMATRFFQMFKHCETCCKC